MYDARTVPRYFLLTPETAVVNGTPALVVDVSVKGARLELFRPLPPGSPVEVVFGPVALDGTVLWSELDSLNLSGDLDRYVIGVLFGESSAAVGDWIEELCREKAAITINDSRAVDRFRIVAPVTGSFGEVAPVSVLDLSLQGARISVPVRLTVGQREQVRFQVDDESGPIDVAATVMWCAQGQTSRQFEAGLKIEHAEPQLRIAIQRLCLRDEARIDLNALKRKFDALRLEARIAELSPRHVAAS